jgi:tetratricopeptide (TPR) repeat protein
VPKRSPRPLPRAQRLLEEGRALQYPTPRLPRPPGGTRGPIEPLRRAIAKYSEAIALEPRLAEAYIRRAIARSQVGDRRGAHADSKKAFALKPREPMDYLFISFSFPGAERRRVLRAGLARTRRGSDDYVRLATQSALTHWYEGRFDLQARALRRLIRGLEKTKQAPATLRLHYDVGSALEALGRFRSAERHYRIAFAEGGTFGTLARLSAVACRVYDDDLDGALRVLDEVAPALETPEATLLRAYLRALGPAPLTVPPSLLKTLLAPAGVYRNDYMGAVVLLRLGRRAVAAPRLRKYITHCESNPTEWGVTQRWEIAKAKALLAEGATK